MVLGKAEKLSLVCAVTLKTGSSRFFGMRQGSLVWVIISPGMWKIASVCVRGGSNKRGIDIHQLLEEKAGKLKVGRTADCTGLVERKSIVLVDVDLTGLLIVHAGDKTEEITAPHRGDSIRQADHH